MKVVIAKTEKIDGLETWLPQRNSTMHLCENRSGPFVKIEDYAILERAAELAIAAGHIRRDMWDTACELAKKA